jgi:hypothetical protein
MEIGEILTAALEKSCINPFVAMYAKVVVTRVVHLCQIIYLDVNTFVYAQRLCFIEVSFRDSYVW